MILVVRKDAWPLSFDGNKGNRKRQANGWRLGQLHTLASYTDAAEGVTAMLSQHLQGASFKLHDLEGLLTI